MLDRGRPSYDGDVGRPFEHRRSPLAARLGLVALALCGLPPVLSAQGFDAPGIPYRLVTWEDFKGAGPVAGEAVALIATGIHLAPLKLEIAPREGGTWRAAAVAPRVSSFMNPWASGVLPGGKSERALAHEQVHFDIAEIHARRLRAGIARLEVSGDDPLRVRREAERRIWELYRESSEELEKMQKRYDRETAHGTRRRSQSRWQREVRGLLETGGRDGG